jgi:hypothetical protein
VASLMVTRQRWTSLSCPPMLVFLHPAGYAEAGSGGESDDDEATLDITELPTRALAVRAKPMTQQLGAHLAHLSQAGCGQQVHACMFG